MHAPDEQAHAVAAALAEIQRRIAAVPREPRQDVTLIAVSKQQPQERILAALEAGQRAFGENYVQEAAGRWPELRQRFPGCELHLIGALQSNKAADAVRLFDVIQTLDRPKLAVALAREFDRQGLRRRLYIEVNTGEELQKAGIRPDELAGFAEHCRCNLHLEIEGLMAIPPAEDDLAPHAALLRLWGQRLGIDRLSIGMSADFEIAVRFGATHVRVGSAIFGARPTRR